MTRPTHDSNGDGEHGMTRRQLMRHSAWFGGAVVLTVTGGEVISHLPGSSDAPPAGSADLRFVQVSDSHIGFQGPPNMDVAGTFASALNQVNSLGFRPDFVMHSGDLTHLSTPAQFDQVKQMLSQVRTDRVFTVPGEHDSIGDNGVAYRQTFAKNTLGDGWYSFDTHGVHFIALVNTLHLEQLGHLGNDQIDFVRKDIAGLSSDTPIVIFSHIPLFAMYPKWGWGTDDAVQVLSMLRRFSSVTCLNGHVHQLFTKTEGNITFHAAAPTCYPFPKPGQGPGPIPQVLPAGRLKDALGIRTVNYRQGSHALAVKDEKLV
ncbi:metallophosphoesterase family protein [Streptantibioticus rubrisoli]|uniref:Metallophosphoesterase n=1 Tax=Streptantibioticus rubrisoli TaxID=1387313 RepID=A0ABT1PEJ5_9ACTN|nr:metallophosphoesterase [Streptantibioticus rubrisoli]MCQ4043797.1 metallophosphoesterase [Streptantibioticus rubrisoli]